MTCRTARPVFYDAKFRSMRIDTPEVATDELGDATTHIHRLGLSCRTSLDDLPQIYSVLRGDMSIVGPRPALHTQHGLIATSELRLTNCDPA